MKTLDYVNLSNKIFDNLNGVINKYNTNIILEINNDMLAYGSLYLRSKLLLNLNKIIKDLNNDREMIETNILFVICHELFHADQVVDDEQYLTSEEYRLYKEEETNYRAIFFILSNLKKLEEMFNITINRNELLIMKNDREERCGINNIGDYCRYSEEDIIKKTLVTLAGEGVLSHLEDYFVFVQIYNNDFSENIIIKDNGYYKTNCIYRLQYYLRNHFKNIVNVEFCKSPKFPDYFNRIIKIKLKDDIKCIEYISTGI